MSRALPRFGAIVAVGCGVLELGINEVGAVDDVEGRLPPSQKLQRATQLERTPGDARAIAMAKDGDYGEATLIGSILDNIS